MTKFLTFILFLVLGVYLFGAIVRWLLRRWILRKQREFAEQFGEQGGHRTYRWGAGANRNGNSAREGEIRVQKESASPKRVRIDVGEYVEYEEYESVEIIEPAEPECDSLDREQANN